MTTVEPSTTLEASCALDGELVPAGEVSVTGPLDTDDEAMVRWALGRFDAAHLELPPVIFVSFDPIRVPCDGMIGRCLPDHRPPEIYICEEDGDTAFRILNRELTLLHELAHVWHWAQGTGAVWPDYAEVVGGAAGSPDVAWADRTEERVATAISWGLMDQLRRPVRTPFDCAELYQQFERLTGTEPLGPLESVCVPAGADTID